MNKDLTVLLGVSDLASSLPKEPTTTDEDGVADLEKILGIVNFFLDLVGVSKLQEASGMMSENPPAGADKVFKLTSFSKSLESNSKMSLSSRCSDWGLLACLCLRSSLIFSLREDSENDCDIFTEITNDTIPIYK